MAIVIIESDIHPIQVEILTKLQKIQSARFSDLALDHLSSDQLAFHLKQLQKKGLLIKDDEYSLSDLGKETANRFKKQDSVMVRTPSVSVMVVGGLKKLMVRSIILCKSVLNSRFMGTLVLSPTKFVGVGVRLFKRQ
jgi:hypothetical protein